jgi:MFS family permease
MIGLTVHMPLYYEVVYGLSASEAGVALIPLVAVSVLGAWASGRAMTMTKHYKRAAIGGATISACAAITIALATPLPLWVLLALLSLLAVGLGTVFPVSVVSIQNAVPRNQVGTATGAMNFFRSLMASFTVAIFTAILLMALGSHLSIGEEHRAGAQGIAASDLTEAFRYVFGAAAALLGAAAMMIVVMEERPLAGPGTAGAASAVAE